MLDYLPIMPLSVHHIDVRGQATQIQGTGTPPPSDAQSAGERLNTLQNEATLDPKIIPVTTLKAVAFDPGITTGYAVGVLDKGVMKVRSGQAKWRHIDLYNQLTIGDPDFIIWEKFYFRKHFQHEGVELYPRELIGVIHLYLQQHEKVVGYQQNPMKSSGSFHSNMKLKEDGVYVAGQPHGMDALRHLLYWYTFGAGYRYNTKGYVKA